MFKAHMKISEYVIAPELGVPLDVADKIHQYHAHPMSYVRHLLGVPIIVSKSSGYRPLEHEESKGRSGITEHRFAELDRPGSIGLGAADYVSNNLRRMFVLMVEHTPYHRYCFYPNSRFIHADYRFYGTGDKQFFIMENGSWKAQSYNKMIEAIKKHG